MTSTAIVGATVLRPGGESPLVDAVVVIDADRIVAVGPRASTPAPEDAELVDGEGRLVLPGLINAHCHVAMGFVRGLADVAGEPIYDVMWPLENVLTEDDVAALARLGVADGLRSGTTTFVDHYFAVDRVADAVVELGARGWLGQTVLVPGDGAPAAFPADLDTGLAAVERWTDAHPRIRPVAAPHAPDTVPDAWLRELAAAGAPVHLHLAQTARELEVVGARTGRSPVAHLAELGVLDGRVLAAHCTHATAADHEILAAHDGVTPIYCPTVHALDGRVLPAADLVTAGRRVGIGTDAPPNDRFSVLAEVRAAVTGQGVLTGRRRALPPAAALAVATEGNADALGAADLGRLEVGATADVVLVDLRGPAGAPATDPVTAAVMGVNDAGVERVWVGGEPVVVEGALVGVDERAVAAEATATVRDLLRRAGLAR